MDANKILGKYDRNHIARMVSGGGTLKQRLADKKTLEKDAELRELVFQLKTQLQQQRETYIETLLEEQRMQALAIEDEADTEDVSISDEEYEEWVDRRKIKVRLPFTVWVNEKVDEIWGFSIQHAASILLLLSSIGVLGGGGYRYVAERNIAESGNYLADNTPEYEVSGTQGLGDESNTVEIDTIFNVGTLSLRSQYESVSDNDYDTFKQVLNSKLNEADTYQRQSKQYWTSWVLYNEQKYNEAIASFETLRATLPAGTQRQRATIGLMHSLWKSDQHQREGFVGFVTTLWSTDQRKRLKEVATATLEEKEGDIRAQSVAKRYLEILK